MTLNIGVCTLVATPDSQHLLSIHLFMCIVSQMARQGMANNETNWKQFPLTGLVLYLTIQLSSVVLQFPYLKQSTTSVAFTSTLTHLSYCRKIVYELKDCLRFRDKFIQLVNRQISQFRKVWRNGRGIVCELRCSPLRETERISHKEPDTKPLTSNNSHTKNPSNEIWPYISTKLD